MQMKIKKGWNEVCWNFIKKVIEELSFEGFEITLLLAPLKKYSSGSVKVERSKWGGYWVKGFDDLDINQTSVDTGQYISNLNGTLLKMKEADLIIFLTELHQTLRSDLILWEKLTSPPYDKIDIFLDEQFDFLSWQKVLNGHPKLLLNKGRLGWTEADLKNFSPEMGPKFQLRYLKFKNKEDLIPIHPWQFSNKIQTHFQHQLMTGEIEDLGVFGDFYTPQVSLRTLSNVTDPLKPDVKISLSLLNTSSFRGLEPKSLKLGGALYRNLKRKVDEDEFLKERVILLEELAAESYPHPHQEEFENLGYQYKELMGYCWRESVFQVLNKIKCQFSHDEFVTIIPAAALTFNHPNYPEGEYLLKLIDQSKLSYADWFEKYIDRILLPLYHFVLVHGVGIIGHGQNALILLKDFAPEKIILKDYHGDVRFCENFGFEEKLPGCSILPMNHLIHDFFTGHLVSVYRYLDHLIDLRIPHFELNFLMKNLINNYYQKFNLENLALEKNIHLLKRKEWERVLLNQVRFVKGYGETSERLKPILGESIQTVNIFN
jgi:aerobactin synthase